MPFLEKAFSQDAPEMFKPFGEEPSKATVKHASYQSEDLADEQEDTKDCNKDDKVKSNPAKTNLAEE